MFVKKNNIKIKYLAITIGVMIFISILFVYYNRSQLKQQYFNLNVINYSLVISLLFLFFSSISSYLLLFLFSLRDKFDKSEIKVKFIAISFLQIIFSPGYSYNSSLKIKILIAILNLLIAIFIIIFNLKDENIKLEYFYLAIVFILYFLWSVVLPFNKGPDEYMRYDIPKFIYNYGNLPRGDDELIRNEVWGFSYAFSPILTYIFSAISMKIASIFSTSEYVLLLAARLISVFFSTGTAFFCIKIGKKIFKGIYVWLFVILVTLIPQFAFVSSYVNCDAIAVFSVSWIIYAMIVGNEKGWTVRTTLFMGTGMGICMMSYYNTYVIIIVSAIFCVVSVFINKDIDKKVKFIFSRILLILLPILLIAGWWFIRNYIIYDGDILGFKTIKNMQEMYAIEELKPSNKSTPFSMGYSLSYMFNQMQFIEKIKQSFIGCFGYMDLGLKPFYYQAYNFIIGIGLFNNLIPQKVKSYGVKNSKIFNGAMVGMCVSTIALTIYYAYFLDFQAQGRYLFPMLIAFFILVVRGLASLAQLFPEKFRKLLIYMVLAIIFWISLRSLFVIVIPTYLL